MATFEPVAVVGLGCVLPGAPNPDALWSLVQEGRSALGNAPAGRWGLPRADVMGTLENAQDRTWSEVGGYVTGFLPSPSGLGLPAELLATLDPGTQWLVEATRQALAEANRPLTSDPRAGLIVGNLSYPSTSMARWAERTWLGRQEFLGGKSADIASIPEVSALSRFGSGMPAHLTAKALGLGLGGLAIDAACASSLYAIALACRRLHDREADLMVAGGLNAADDLFIHVGFCALSAMSKTGRSRPFDRDADGLVPGEGCAVVVLKRLADAARDGDRVLGVIRGVGLSNDGRGRGLLAPSEEGQTRALRAAYASSGLSPKDIGLLECHATGTPVGDATEIRSTAGVFEGLREVPMGSLKSNLGHLITSSGAAAMIKVLQGLRHGIRPATIDIEHETPALAGTPFRVLRKAEAWDGPRRAGISGFGFGGNNAHVIVETWDGHLPSQPAAAKRREPVVVVAIGARVGQGNSCRDFADALATGAPTDAKRASIAVDAEGLRFPPKDLEQALPQQLLVLEAAREATQGMALPRERTAILVGMGMDPEVARYGARWRLPGWAVAWRAAGAAADAAWVAGARDAFERRLEAPGVIGKMPNIPANRISAQLDIGGPGYTVSSEESSGLDALRIAVRALEADEIDAAIVAAVDLSHEPAHLAALAALGLPAVGGDTAIALVLKREKDARAAGDRVIARIDSVETGVGQVVPNPAADVDDALCLGMETGDDPQLGRPHAALGLLRFAAAALAVGSGQRIGTGPAKPWLGPRVAAVAAGWFAERGTTGWSTARVSAGDLRGWLPVGPPRLHTFAGANRADVARRVASGTVGGEGPARFVAICADDDLVAVRARAGEWLASGKGDLTVKGPRPVGMAYTAAPVGGELAFVFGGPAGAYSGMGQALLSALPALVDRLEQRTQRLASALAWVYAKGDPPERALDKLWGASALSQVHAELTRGLLKLSPTAVLGYSSGESNALVAMGAWPDCDTFVANVDRSDVFARDLCNEFRAPKQAWAKVGATGQSWTQVAVRAPLDVVEKAVATEPTVRIVARNAPGDYALGGDPDAIRRVAAKGGFDVFVLGYNLAIHAPEVAEVRDGWRALHHLRTEDVPGVRFYTNATGTSYRASADACADALTGQAVQAIDWARTIEQAYADGVRVFIEHGPRAGCTRWTKAILGDRPHLATALDVGPGAGISPVYDTLAALVAHQIPCAAEALVGQLALAAAPARPPSRALTFPAHPKEIVLPALTPADALIMAKAPKLPPASDKPVTTLAAPSGSTVMAAPGPRHVDQAPVARPAADAAPTMAYAPSNDVLANLAAFHAQVGAVHQDYLAQQAALHQRFLGTRAALMETLRQAYAGGVIDVDVAPPVPPPTVVQVHEPVRVVEPVRAVEPVRVVEPVRAPAAVKPAEVIAKVAPVSPSAGPLPGPKFDRKQLEILSSGRISDVFGPEFVGQDQYAIQVRMPEPPLLLADRVTGIAAVAKSMGKGTIYTETDVRADSWYLNEGRMPSGVHIESGQADLLLISWLGADFQNKGERKYRLLGCELTWHEGKDGGTLPAIGDTLKYDIHVDGHAAQGAVRLFFFHYDCRIDDKPRLTVRSGQAGFFTDQELAESGGVLWDAETGEHKKDARVDPPAIALTKRSFSSEDLRVFTEGRPWECFGPAFDWTKSHVRTPTFQAGKMLFLREVTDLDPTGGPWGRGYLRATWPVTPDDWFFVGHFKNDPCMPGTMMFEGCVQAMAFYLAAMGFSVDKDGWRFEPVPDLAYALRCRGQVVPTSKNLVYEIFVEEVVSGPIPTLYADLLCTIDGLKAFHARRVGLRLVPDWPMETWRHLPKGPEARVAEFDHMKRLPLVKYGGLAGYKEPKPVAVSSEGFPFDYQALLACAWGKPSDAFGPIYKRFDSPRKVARLPGPPYHFMSRILKVDGPLGGMKIGTTMECEYDVPAECWYFEDNGYVTMPFCVLMEAALQPCGWLASYVGSALGIDKDLLFRNLDGTGTTYADILPGDTFRTQTKITNISQSSGMIIESFDVKCFVGDKLVFTMNTVFGYFPPEAFHNQVGLPYTPDEKTRIFAPQAADVVNLRAQPARYFEGPVRLPGQMSCMLDRVVERTPAGGKKGKGFYRAVKDVDKGEWFFRAHFYQDPVQPGSLGVEALVQLVQFAMLDRGLDNTVPNGRFEPIAFDKATTWRYRGQVTPKNKQILYEIEVTDEGTDERGAFMIVDGALWVDDKRIYAVKNMAMRIVPRGDAPPTPSGPKGSSRPGPGDETLDPKVDTWLGDHRPTWTMPALPAMSMIDHLAGAVVGTDPVVAIRDVQVHRWLAFGDEPAKLRTEVVGHDGKAISVALSAWRAAKTQALSRYEPVASGTVVTAATYPSAPAAPAPLDAPLEADPYTTGSLFHGPAFHALLSWRLGPNGASTILDVDRLTVPRGTLNQGLLDAITHAIPHDSLHRWSNDIAADRVAYPYRVPSLELFGPLPSTGQVRCEVRFAGFEPGDGPDAHRYPRFDAWLIGADGVVLLKARLVEVLLPKGPIGQAPPADRRAFLDQRRYVPGVALSALAADSATADPGTIRATDWLPGNVARIYALATNDAVAEVAIKDHVARHAWEHPSRIDVAADLTSAVARTRPLRRHPVALERDGDAVIARDAGRPFLDTSPIRAFWDRWFGIGRWPVEDVYYGLIERFVNDVIVADPDAFDAVRGRSVLYLANHQVGVESLLFSVIASGLSGVPTVTLAKAEHRHTWLGKLIELSWTWPGARDPRVITFFDREDKPSLLRIVGEIAQEMKTSARSAMVHVEGTRSLECRTPVQKMSSAFLDMALAIGAPIVPVRLAGALPVEPMESRIEYPVGYGRQDVWIGRPILAEQLATLPFKDRKQFVIDAMNGLGPDHKDEQPFPGDSAFAARVESRVAKTGATADHAALYEVLAERSGVHPSIRAILDGAGPKTLADGSGQGAFTAELCRRLDPSRE